MSADRSSRRFPWRIFSRVVLIQAVLVLAALATSGLLARHFFKRQFTVQIENQLRDTLQALSSNTLAGQLTPEWCASHAQSTSLRFTLISHQGVVLCDSHRNAKEMDNHASRPEFIDALAHGYGHSLRHSDSLDEDMMYAAIALKNSNNILRASVPLAHLRVVFGLFDTTLGAFLLLVAVVLSLFAAWSGRALVFPIGRLLVKAENALEENREKDESDTLGEESFGEWSELESSLDNLRRDLQSKAESLTHQRDELATLMSAISDAILAVDTEEIPLFFNSRFALLFDNEQLQKRSVRLWEFCRTPEILEAFRAALKEGKSTSVKPIAFETEVGKRYFSISVSPLTQRTGKIYGAVGVFHDVTELKLAEQIRIDFVANVSHELRTPLTAIKGYTETLIHDTQVGKPVETDFLEVIARNANRLMSLIGDLLDLSALESIDILAKAKLSTEEATSRVVKQMQEAFAAKSQSIGIRTEQTFVFADPRRLEQVLVNLLDNANKYTPVGGKISVVWEPAPDPSADVVLKVTDSGPGIPPEHHPRLFERFYRVDKARSREQGGTGLGLAIVKHIMQRHDGIVSVESPPGQGATFICRFPG